MLNFPIRVALALAVGSLSALSQTVVNPGADLQGVVNGAPAGATILLNPGTYSLSGQLYLPRSITIRNNLAGTMPTLSFPANTVIVVYAPTSGVTLEGLQILGGTWSLYMGDGAHVNTITGPVLRNLIVSPTPSAANPGHGIYITKTVNALVENVTITNTQVNGIFVDGGSTGLILRNNTVNNTVAGDGAIKIQDTNDAILAGNRVKNTGPFAHGINLINSKNAVLDGNVVERADQTGIGITLGSDGALVINNTVESTTNSHAIVVQRANFATISGNRILGSGFHGIILSGASYCRVESNYITGHKYDGITVTKEDVSATFSRSNYVGRNITNSNGYVTSRNAGTGIWLNSETNGNLVANNTVVGEYEGGFAIFNSSFNHLRGNESSTHAQGGIFVWESHDSFSSGPKPNLTYLQGNYLHDQAANGGIILRNADNSVISSNAFRGSATPSLSGGVQLETTSGNQVYYNIIRDVTNGVGLYATAGTQNTTYFRNRHYNTRNHSVAAGSGIQLDGGVQMKGNYWSDAPNTVPYTNFVPPGNNFRDNYPFPTENLDRSYSISVVQPYTGQILAPGTRKVVHWISESCPYVDLYYRSAVSGTVPLSLGYPNTGYYNWDLAPTLTPASDYTIVADCKTSAGTGTGVTVQSGTFTVAKPGLVLLSPGTDSNRAPGSTARVSWSRSAAVPGVNVLVKTGTGSYATVASNVTANNFVDVILPSVNSSRASILVQSTADTALADATDGYFRISNTGAVTNIVAGSNFSTGTIIPVEWTSPADSYYVDIDLFDGGTFRRIATTLPDFGYFEMIMPAATFSTGYVRLSFKNAGGVALGTVNSATFNGNGSGGGGGQPAPPTADSISPSSGQALTQTFTLTASDPNGATDISTVFMLVNSSLVTSTACYLEYNRANNQFRLADNSGTVFSAPSTVGSGAALSNGQCTITPAGATANASGNTLTVTIPITFNNSFLGPRTSYLQAVDAAGQSSNWQQRGTFTVGQGTTAGTSSVFVSRTGTVFVDANANLQFDAGDRTGSFGQAGDFYVLGDWNGDGRSKIGVFRNGDWFLDFNGNLAWDGPAVDRQGRFGQAGDIPIVGRWDGTNVARVGVFRNGEIFLDFNGNLGWDGSVTDRAGFFGLGGDVPLVGDWNGDGRSKIGVFRGGQIYLDLNGNLTWDGSPTDRAGAFGQQGDIPFVGQWTGTAITSIGVYRGGSVYLDLNGDSFWSGDAVDKAGSFGIPNDRPLPGDWTGTGVTRFAVVRNGDIFVDQNGSLFFDAGDRSGHFGQAGDVFLVGKL